MGCKICKRESQIINPIKTEEKEEVKEEKDPLEFDAKTARKLVKFLLSEDNVYRECLNYILLFDEKQLENLFKGNEDYKKYPYRNIEDKNQFKYLLMKFEDYSDILFEWYKDESRYDDLIKLWKSQLNITNLNKLSNEDLEKKLVTAGISNIDIFMIDFRSIVNNSIESKSSDIKNYLKEEYKDFYSLIETSIDFQEDPVLSNEENKEIFELNFKNIVSKLVQTSFPLVKKYIKDKYLNLNTLSKIQLESEMLNKLKNAVIDEIKGINKINSSEGVGFNNVSEIINAFKNGNIVEKMTEGIQNHFNNPAVAISYLTMSFMNLSVAAKTYYNNSVEFNAKQEKYSTEMKNINNDFEMHKKEIGLIDLDNYKESMKKIEKVGKKIYQDKLKVQKFIENLDKEEANIKDEKKKKGIKDALKCAGGIFGSAIGFVATGGILAAIYASAFIISGIAMGLNIADLIKMKKQLNIYKDFKEKENKKYEEIENSLADLNYKFNIIQDRYIPVNV